MAIAATTFLRGRALRGLQAFAAAGETRSKRGLHRNQDPDTGGGGSRAVDEQDIGRPDG